MAQFATEGLLAEASEAFKRTFKPTQNLRWFFEDKTPSPFWALHQLWVSNDGINGEWRRIPIAPAVALRQGLVKDLLP